MSYLKPIRAIILMPFVLILCFGVASAQDDHGDIWWLSWHPSGDSLAISYRDDNTIYIRDAMTLQITQTFTVTDPQRPSTTYTLGGLRWSPDGNKIAIIASISQGGQFTQLLDLNTRQVLWTVHPQSIGWDTVSVIGWSSDGTELLVYLREGRGLIAKYEVQIWDALSMESRLAIRLFEPSPWASWSPDGTQIVTTIDETVVVWDAEMGTQLLTLVGHTGFVTDTEWSPDGSRIVTSGEDVRIWDSSTGQQLSSMSIRTVRSSVNQLSWSPDGTRIAILDDPDSWIWDIASNQLTERLSGHHILLWSPDGSRLVTITYRRSLRFLDPSGTPIPIPPIANADLDQEVVDSDNSGSEPVTLDGSGSSDFDGPIVSYMWTENDTEIATGVNPQVDLSVGLHTITLTVTDDSGATDSDEVVIEVTSSD